MPGEVIIGSVSVKVMPDLSNFRRETRASLERVEKTLSDVEVDVTPNAKGFRRAIYNEIRRAEATAPKFDVDVRFPSIKYALGGLSEQIKKTKLRAEIEPVLDTADLKRRLGLSMAQIRIKKMRTILIDPKINPKAVATFTGELSWLLRNEVKNIFVRVNKASLIAAGRALNRISGLRMLYDLHMQKFKVLANFDRHAPKIASVALALAMLSNYLAAAAGNVLSLANGIAAIVPGLLALPGMFAGLAAAVWVTKTAFEDFGDILPGFKDSMDELRDAVSANFWKKAQVPIQEFLTKIFPQFSAGMRKLATATGGYVSAMARSMQRELDGRLEKSMGKISQAMTIMSKSAADTSRWLRILLETGLNQLPAFAGWWNKINKQFADFMTQASASGQLQKWIDTAVKNLQHLGSIVVNLGKTFWNLGEIMEASGASTLASLDKTMQRAAEITSSPKFVTGLTRVMTSVYDTIDTIGAAIQGKIGALATALSTSIPLALASIAGPLGAVIAGLLDGLAGEQFQEGFLQMFSGIGVALNALAPVMDVLAAKIGIVFGLVGDIVAQMGPLLATFIGEIAGMLEIIGPSLSGALAEIGPAMGDAFVTLGPVFTTLAQAVSELLIAVGPLIAQLASGLAPILAQIGQAVAGALLQAIQIITPYLPQLAEAFLQIMDALAPLIPLLAQAFVEILKESMPIVLEIVKGIAGLVTVIAPLVESALPILVNIIKFIIKVVGDAVAGVINGIRNVVEGVIEVIKGIWELFAGFFTMDFNRMWEGIKKIFSGVWQTIVGLLEVWWNVGILGFLRKGLSILKASWGGIWNGIKAAVTAVWNGIKTGISAAWKFVSGLVTKGLTGLKSAWTAGWGKIRSFLTQAWEGIKKGVSTGISAVIDFFKGLPGKIKDILSGAADWLRDIGGKIIQGLIDGIKGAIGGVKDTLGGLTSKIREWKGPPKKDKKLLIPAGELLIDGLIKGIEGRRSDLRDVLGKFTRDIERHDFGAINAPDLKGLAKDRRSVQSAFAQAGVGAASVAPVYNINTEVNGSNLTATDVAEQILYGVRRVNRGGVYGPRV